MKNFFLLLALFGALHFGHAQFLNWGVKGGINYNSNGDLRATDFSDFAEIGSGEETGYHLGLLAEIKLPLFLYIRPELIYTHTESSYSSGGERTRLKMDKIEAPVLTWIQSTPDWSLLFWPLLSIHCQYRSVSNRNPG